MQIITQFVELTINMRNAQIAFYSAKQGTPERQKFLKQSIALEKEFAAFVKDNAAYLTKEYTESLIIPKDSE